MSNLMQFNKLMNLSWVEKDVTIEPTAVNAWAEGKIIFIELTDG